MFLTLSTLTVPCRRETSDITLILQMRKLGHRKVKNLIQGHTGKDRQSRIPARHHNDSCVNFFLIYMITFSFGSQETSSFWDPGLGFSTFPCFPEADVPVDHGLGQSHGLLVLKSEQLGWQVRIPDSIQCCPAVNRRWEHLHLLLVSGRRGFLSSFSHLEPRWSCVPVILQGPCHHLGCLGVAGGGLQRSVFPSFSLLKLQGVSQPWASGSFFGT